jgi:rsbT co-antagonist protein RsbR
MRTWSSTIPSRQSPDPALAHIFLTRERHTRRCVVQAHSATGQAQRVTSTNFPKVLRPPEVASMETRDMRSLPSLRGSVMRTASAQRSEPGLLEIDRIDPEAFLDFWNVYDAHYAEITERTRESAKSDPEFSLLMDAADPAQTQRQDLQSRAWVERAIVGGDWESYAEYLRQIGTTYAAIGMSFGGWIRVLGMFRPPMCAQLFRDLGDDMPRLESALSAMNGFFDFVTRVVGDRYLSAKEMTIRQQQDAIRELSTPVLELSEGLLLLPIVGVVDSHRARQMTEQLLKAIREHRAKVVVVDITGVPVVDTMVANHLVRATEVARLLGAASVVTGLSAEVARTMVKIGINLSGLHTVGTLRAGIVEANKIIGSQRASLS